jgi:hypothetical protein
MPQHIWIGKTHFRTCEDCNAYQVDHDGEWLPAVYPICPGDDEDGGRRVTRRRPNAPSGAPREREVA